MFSAQINDVVQSGRFILTVVFFVDGPDQGDGASLKKQIKNVKTKTTHLSNKENMNTIKM